MAENDNKTALDTDVMALPIPDEDMLDEDIKTYFAKCREKLGMVPNVLKAYTIRPEKFRTFSRFYNELMLGDSGLSKLEREMVAVVVSSVNRCYYCLVAMDRRSASCPATPNWASRW